MDSFFLETSNFCCVFGFQYLTVMCLTLYLSAIIFLGCFWAFLYLPEWISPFGNPFQLLFIFLCLFSVLSSEIYFIVYWYNWSCLKGLWDFTNFSSIFFFPLFFISARYFKGVNWVNYYISLWISFCFIYIWMTGWLSIKICHHSVD